MLNYLINCSLFNKVYSARTCMSAHYEIMLASPVLRDEKRFCKDTVTSAGSYNTRIKLNGNEANAPESHATA